jgi:phosphate transport system substrate-binding protein
LGLLACSVASLGQQPKTAHYQPARQVTGTVRIWGHGSRRGDYIGELLGAWEQDFERVQPGVSFRNELYGDDSALGGVYTGAADLALLDREPLAIEDDGFEQVLGYRPFGIRVAYGRFRSSNQAPALAVFVHRTNPLARLTLDQLKSIFGADQVRGSSPIRHWSDLGIKEPLGSRLIHLYGFGVESNEARFFERTVLQGGGRWNCSLQEFYDGSYGGKAAAGRIADALSKDPEGIAISTPDVANGSIKPVSLGSDKSGPFEMPDESTLRSGRYPLTRSVYFYLNRKPGSEINETVREFLNFVVSADGQSEMIRLGSYLPLAAAESRQSQEELQ